MKKDKRATGELEGFPSEVIDLMLERQFEQSDKKDVKIFQRDAAACSSGCGFDWDGSAEGFNFWYDIIIRKNFDVFFERCPNKESIQPNITIKIIVGGQETDLNEWVTIKEYCELFNIKNVQVITNWIKRGIIPADCVREFEILNQIKLIKKVKYK